MCMYMYMCIYTSCRPIIQQIWDYTTNPRLYILLPEYPTNPGFLLTYFYFRVLLFMGGMGALHYYARNRGLYIILPDYTTNTG